MAPRSVTGIGCPSIRGTLYPEVDVMKIMVCHDGSESAQFALEKTLELFRREKPEIILLTVVEEPLDASMENEDIFLRYRQERHDFIIKTSNEVADKGFEVDAILAVGDPRRMIPEAVENKSPDVLVVARRGAGGMAKMLLGSVSAYLLRHVQCPVLVFHK